MSGAHVLNGVLVLALAGAYVAQLVRWARVLQREHYEPASMWRFLVRWSVPTVANANSPERSNGKRPIAPTQVLLVLVLASVFLRSPVVMVVLTVVYGLSCPRGLSMRGRTGTLHWTRRLVTVVTLATVLALIVSALGLLSLRAWFGAVIVVWSTPTLLALAARLLTPYEDKRAQVFVDQAKRRLERVHPLVVGITGSYGKTSTKNHLAALLEGDGGVVATPRSFNNRAGLSRAINEHLADGTRVFIAEMGTYGPGEIAELCAWCPPSLAIITAIGPVHLERMGSLDTIERAKFEITTTANTVIVNDDDPRLAQWASRLHDKRVRRAGSRSLDADVVVRQGDGEWLVLIDGEEIARLAPVSGVQATNLACAIAAAVELGLPHTTIAARLPRVTPVANRANVVTAPSGVVVIDDTFNANPESARSSLALLRELALPGRRVVVTPGLIELGPEQGEANRTLAGRVAAMGAELVIVNATNALDLQAGYEGVARRFNHRDDAVAWVREALRAGDGVLYLNDLPDHYP